MSDWSGKRVTVLGLGRSGISTAFYLKRMGASVLLSEQNKVEGARVSDIENLKSLDIAVETGCHSQQAVNDADIIVTSPGVKPTADVVQRALKQGKEVICDIEIAYRDRGGTQIIGITGTNGKSTTCALVSHILEQSGFSAPSCGNFGVPILDKLSKAPDYLVAEVSSFQLHYCPTFAPRVGVFLNLTADHLEWHGSLEAYLDDKKKMFLHQSADQYAVLNMDDTVLKQFHPPSEIFPFAVDADQSQAIQAAFMSGDYLCYRMHAATRIVCSRDELKIIGKHNLENLLASLCVAAILGVDHEKLVRAVTSFTALEHRLEFVEAVAGVEFYNDSKATNPTSTIKALEAFGGKKIVLIAGGRDKGTALDELVQCARQHVSDVILLGEAKERFTKAFSEGGFKNLHLVETMQDAVELGAQLKKGPVVLSPACASFDMFKDYEERGRVFKNLVRARVEKMARSH